jgi:hypothetical protein
MTMKARGDQCQRIAAPFLVIGAILGMLGTFAPSASLRGLAWGVDGTMLTAATALLTIHHFRRGHDTAAAGFLIFAIGEALILSGSSMDLVASAPAFAAGCALWAVSLALISASGIMPLLIRTSGAVGSALFTIVALDIFWGLPLTPLSQPLPFFAFPFLAATLFGWAWVHFRNAD